jgi:hypothetical protein
MTLGGGSLPGPWNAVGTLRTVTGAADVIEHRQPRT